MHLFLDCEFTCFDAPELLSVGLCGRDGELYLELSGAAIRREPSEFVQVNVLPQLGLMPRTVNSLDELGRQLGRWLTQRKGPLSLCYDFHTDADLFQQALETAGLWEDFHHLQFTHVGYLLGVATAVLAMEKSSGESRKRDGVGKHHALADARALRAAFIAVHGDVDE